MQKNEMAKVYETFLSMPSMDTKVRLTFNLPVKAAFLLSRLIERAMAGKGAADEAHFGVLELLSGDMARDLNLLPKEILEKTGLTEINDRLISLTEKHA